MTSPVNAAARWTTASTPASSGVEVRAAQVAPARLDARARRRRREPATGRSSARTRVALADQRAAPSRGRGSHPLPSAGPSRARQPGGQVAHEPTDVVDLRRGRAAEARPRAARVDARGSARAGPRGTTGRPASLARSERSGVGSAGSSRPRCRSPAASAPRLPGQRRCRRARPRTGSSSAVIRVPKTRTANASGCAFALKPSEAVPRSRFHQRAQLVEGQGAPRVALAPERPRVACGPTNSQQSDARCVRKSEIGPPGCAWEGCGACASAKTLPGAARSSADHRVDVDDLAEALRSRSGGARAARAG